MARRGMGGQFNAVCGEGQLGLGDFDGDYPRRYR
jgi:hypothetical protein